MAVKIIRWSARILMILGILFMFMFSLDVFGMEAPLKEKLVGFLIHNIPVMILLLVLAISWLKELPGGLLILAASFMMMLKFNVFTTNKGAWIIFVPFVVAGLLFILSYILSATRKNKEGEIR